MKSKTESSEYIIIAFFVVITLWQGGFSALAWFAGGLIFAILLFINLAKLPPKEYIIAFTAIAAGYIISGVVNGTFARGYMGLASVITVFLFVLLANKPKPEELTLLPGLLVAGLGVLSYSGWLPLPGAVEAGRIFGVFQYANATGLFLAACAFITRLSNKREWAPVMETALILTQSIGSLAVYFIGWLVYFLIYKQENIKYNLFGFLFSGMMAAGFFAVSRYTPVPWAAPLIIIGYILGREHVGKALLTLTGKKWAVIAACAMLAVFAAGVFFVRGTQPLLTYAERMIQISDGARTMLGSPFGLGYGGWQLHVYEYQSAPYDANLIHSSITQIGVNGGALALCGFLAIIVFWLHGLWKNRRKPEKYDIAALMILSHALLDFTLSYLSVAMLLAVMIQYPTRFAKQNTLQNEKKSQKLIKSGTRIAAAAVFVFFTILIIPEAVKNRADWTANSGVPQPALMQIEEGFILPGDDDAALKRMSYAYVTSDYEALSRAFDDISRPNAQALFQMAGQMHEGGEWETAAQYALQCARLSPYRNEGYGLLGMILPNLPAELQGEYREQAEAIRQNANQNTHYLSKFIYD